MIVKVIQLYRTQRMVVNIVWHTVRVVPTEGIHRHQPEVVLQN